jgi:hypothetical protein
LIWKRIGWHRCQSVRRLYQLRRDGGSRNESAPAAVGCSGSAWLKGEAGVGQPTALSDIERSRGGR